MLWITTLATRPAITASCHAATAATTTATTTVAKLCPLYILSIAYPVNLSITHSARSPHYRILPLLPQPLLPQPLLPQSLQSPEHCSRALLEQAKGVWGSAAPLVMDSNRNHMWVRVRNDWLPGIYGCIKNSPAFSECAADHHISDSFCHYHETCHYH